MGRVFASASSQYLEATVSNLLTDYPCTVNCWYKVSVNFQTFTTTNLSDPTAINRLGVNLQGNVAGDPIRATVQWQPGSQENASTPVAFDSSNTWAMATAVYRTQEDFSVYANGAGRGDSSPPGSGTPNWSLLTGLYIGVLNNGGTFTNYMDGSIAEVAYWNVALTDPEVASLYVAGDALYASNVQPDALVSYARLETDDTAIVGPNFTPVNGPTFGDHPTMTGTPPAAGPFLKEGLTLGGGLKPSLLK